MTKNYKNYVNKSLEAHCDIEQRDMISVNGKII